MNEEPSADQPVDTILESLPPALRIKPDTLTVIDATIRRGEFLNQPQEEVAREIARIVLERRQHIARYDGVLAYEFMRRALAAKSAPELAPARTEFIEALKLIPGHEQVQLLACDILQERKKRNEAVARQPGVTVEERKIPIHAVNVYIARAKLAMQSEGLPNPELALVHLKEGIQAHANNPELLALAAGICRRIVAGLDDADRQVIYLERARTYAGRCLTVLGNPPYAKMANTGKRVEQMTALLRQVEIDLENVGK